MTSSTPRSFFTRLILGILGVYVVYIIFVGLFSTVADQGYKRPDIPVTDDHSRAIYMSEGLVQSIDEEMHSLFGWLPNDLFPVPQFIDNKTNYQRGIIYATRSASDILARRIARYGERDTVPPLLVDATAKEFAYADNVWGWWFLYDSEGHYKKGVKDWRTWASRVTDKASKGSEICNMTTDDIVQILEWGRIILDYALGILNDDKVGHFKSDDVVYYVKGLCRVVGNVIEATIACDDSVVGRGGQENVDECLRRFRMISSFNPTYVVAGSYGVGDSFWPNHIAALARHVDVVSNRLSDIRSAMEK